VEEMELTLATKPLALLRLPLKCQTKSDLNTPVEATIVLMIICMNDNEHIL
jgi:hypothetical protein